MSTTIVRTVAKAGTAALITIAAITLASGTAQAHTMTAEAVQPDGSILSTQ